MNNEDKVNLLKTVLQDPELKELLQEVFKQNYQGEQSPPKISETEYLAQLDKELDKQERQTKAEQSQELVSVTLPVDTKISFNGVGYFIPANTPTMIPNSAKLACLDRKQEANIEIANILKRMGVHVE